MIEKCWEEYPRENIHDIFITMQMVMNKVIEYVGGNDYKLEHIGKKKKAELLLPLTVTYCARLWDVPYAWESDPDFPTDYDTE